MNIKLATRIKNGFTLLEIIIVMGIIGILLSGAFFVYIRIIERSRVNQAIADVQAIRAAVEAYHVDLGFYPPDSSTRGVDPGLATIYNPAPPCGSQGCPLGYNRNLIADGVGNPVNWKGPYMDSWPDETPWGGEYDYNYWPTTVQGCSMEFGIYIAIRPAVSGTNIVPPDAENHFIQNGMDADGCATANGDVHILIKRL